MNNQGTIIVTAAIGLLLSCGSPDVSAAKKLSNACPETKAIGEMVRRNIKELPFSLQEYLQHEQPAKLRDFDWGM